MVLPSSIATRVPRPALVQLVHIVFCSYNYSRYRSDIPKAVSACLSHCVPCIKLCLLHNLATVLVECRLSSMLRIGSYMYIAIACEYNYQYTSHLSAETLALTYMYAIGTCYIRT